MNTVEDYLLKGYNLVYESKESIILEKPKKFSILTWIGLGILTGGLGLFIYPLLYKFMETKRVTIEK